MYQQQAGMGAKRATRWPLPGCLVLLLVGLAALSLMLYSAWKVTVGLYPALVLSTQGQCLVTQSRLIITKTSPSGHPEASRNSFVQRAQVAYTFQTAQGQTIQGSSYDWLDDVIVVDGPDEAQAIVQRYQVGKRYPCWYNALLPSFSALTRDITSTRWTRAVAFHVTPFGIGLGLWVLTICFGLPLLLIVLTMRRTIRKKSAGGYHAPSGRNRA